MLDESYHESMLTVLTGCQTEWLVQFMAVDAVTFETSLRHRARTHLNNVFTPYQKLDSMREG